MIQLLHSNLIEPTATQQDIFSKDSTEFLLSLTSKKGNGPRGGLVREGTGRARYDVIRDDVADASLVRMYIVFDDCFGQRGNRHAVSRGLGEYHFVEN